MNRYVIFRIGHNAFEFYIRPSPTTQVGSTGELSQAIRFPTRREAYEFAAVHHLDDWRVGQR